MPVFRHQIFIARPVEEVFATVADLTTHSKWQKGLLRTDIVSPEAAAAGARGYEVRRLFGREVRFPIEITACNPPRAWGFKAQAGPLRPTLLLTFSGRPGGTLIESRLSIGGLAGRLAGPLLIAEHRQNYRRLKELVESSLQKSRIAAG